MTDNTSATGANRLPALAAEIRAAHAAANAAAKVSAERAMEAGAMLIEARRLVPHGHWADWLRENVGFSERSASRYMRLVRGGFDSATVADLGVRAAAEALAEVEPLAREFGISPALAVRCLRLASIGEPVIRDACAAAVEAGQELTYEWVVAFAEGGLEAGGWGSGVVIAD
jgi:hypothetical protein